MEPYTEHGRTMYSAAATLPRGRPVNYKYVMIFEPRWEDFRGNRVLSLSPLQSEHMWKVQRRDNTHLVQRVCDVVGGGPHHDLTAALSYQGVEHVEGNWFLEPIDLSLSRSVKVHVVVEVSGLNILACSNR